MAARPPKRVRKPLLGKSKSAPEPACTVCASELSSRFSLAVLCAAAVALVPAMAVALSATFSGDYNLFNEINEFLNILQSIQLPFAMLPVLHFASSADLLGRFRSSTTMLVITRLLALLVMAINVLLIVQYLQDLNPAWWVTLLVGVFGVFYFFICACLVWDDLKAGARLLLG